HSTNDVRGQLAGRFLDRYSGDGQGPGMLVAGVADFGRPYAGNDGHHQEYAELGDTFGWSRGSHFLRTGIDFTTLALRGTRPDGMGGVFQFRTVDAFLAGQPDTFRQVFDSSAVSVSARHVGAFAHEHWTPVSGLTLDVGARFDIETLPATLNVTDGQW